MSADLLVETPAAVRDLKQIANLRQAAATYFGRTSPRLMLLAVAVTASLRAYLGAVSLLDLAVVAAVVVFWWLFEWGAHVLLLHAKPRQLLGRTFDPLYARYHRAHHREPWLADWVLVPSRFILLAFVLSGALFWAAFPTAQLATTAWLSFCMMAVIYEWTHLLVHTRYKPRSAFFREIWRNHRLHHFKNENYWFGLSVTVTDVAFGTAPNAAAVPTSTTTRSLGVEEET